MDGGATWRTRTITPPDFAFAIANDGSLPEISGTITLMRLPPGKSTWESLGTLAIAGLSASASYSAGSGKGAIWCVNLWGMDPTTSGEGVVYTRNYA
jgi:hypothetical protein